MSNDPKQSGSGIRRTISLSTIVNSEGPPPGRGGATADVLARVAAQDAAMYAPKRPVIIDAKIIEAAAQRREERLAILKAAHEKTRRDAKRRAILARSMARYFNVQAQTRAARAQARAEALTIAKGLIDLRRRTLADRGITQYFARKAALKTAAKHATLAKKYGPATPLPEGLVDFGMFQMIFESAYAGSKARLVMNGLISDTLGLGAGDYRLLLNLYLRKGAGATADTLGRQVYKVATPSSSAYRGIRNIRKMLDAGGLDGQKILTLTDGQYALMRQTDGAAPARTAALKLRI